jgi:hypothetical protein
MKGSGDFGWPGQVTHRRTRIKAQLEPKKLVHPPFVLNLYCYVLVSFSLKSCRRSMFGVCLLGLAPCNDIWPFNYCSLIGLPLKF